MKSKYDCVLAIIVVVMASVCGYFTYLVKGLQDKMEQAVKETKEVLTSVLQAEYGVKSNSQYANEAIELAKKAIADSDDELAKIYYLNAISHMPSSIKYIEDYHKYLLSQNVTFEELRRLSDILDLAVFNVEPKEIGHMIDIKKVVAERMEEISSSEQKKSVSEEKVALSKRIASLENGDLSLGKIEEPGKQVNVELLSMRLEAIKELLDDGQLDEMQTDIWAKQLQSGNMMLQLVNILAGVHQAVSKAEQIIQAVSPNKQELVTAQNQLQTANALLAQVWTTDCSSVPNLLGKAKGYQKTIADIDGKIKEIASREAYAKIQKINTEIRNTWTGTYTARLKDLDNKIDEIKKTYPDVLDETMQKQVMDILNYFVEYRGKLEKNRYMKYQKWALQQLRECHNHYKSFNVVSDDDGDMLFNTYLLEINPALLSSDLQSLYNSIYQKVYEEVTDKAESQIKKAGYTCKSLEDF